MPVLETDRLLLRPLPLDVARALVLGHRPPDAPWAPDYPTDSTLVAASMVVTAEAEGRPLEPWTAYQVLLRDTRCAIGGCGFTLGAPDDRGGVLVAASVVDSYKGHGYAPEALRALIAWAREHPEVRRVRAETARTNAEGVRLYE